MPKISSAVPMPPPSVVSLPGISLDVQTLPDEAIDKLMQEAEQLGFKIIKTVVPWSAVEPKPGEFVFDRYDRLVQSARAHHLDVLFSLGFTPAWAADLDPGEAPENALSMMPDNLKAWSQYVSVTVFRYNNKVRYWQIWERPSIDNFLGTTQDYLTLLTTASAAARQINPHILIFASEPGGPDLGFIAGLFKAPVVNAWDGIALSPQLETPEQWPEYLDAIRHKMTPQPVKKLLFITDWLTDDIELNQTRAISAYTAAFTQRLDAAFWPESNLFDAQGAEQPTAEALHDFFSTFEPSPQPALTPEESIQGPVCVDFAHEKDHENGLYVHKFRSRKMANPSILFQDNLPAIDLAPNTNAFLYADVDDRYIFFNNGIAPVKITISADANDVSREAGFDIMYDSPRGYVFSPWMEVQAGKGWNDYTIVLSDANFADKGGFDFRVNDLGSKQDVFISKICVSR